VNLHQNKNAAACVLGLLAPMCFLVGCATDQGRDVESINRVLREGTRSFKATSTRPIDGMLSLRDALSTANERSETLSLEGEALIRAVVQRRRAVSAFLPGVGLNPTYQVRDTGQDGSDSTDSNLDVPIDADLVVFDGLRNVNSYWRDVYLVERQRQLLLDVQEQILLDVGQAYYAVLRAEAQVRVLEGSVSAQEERLRDARGRVEAGVARPLDVAQTLAQVAATRVTLIEAKRAVADGRSLLQFLMNAPVDGLRLTDEFDDVLRESAVVEGRSLAQLMTIVARFRSELIASERGIDAARRDVRVALGAYYPSVSIRLSAFLYRETAPDERTWEGVLALSLPIFSGGRIKADVREAWSFLREAILIDSQARRRVGREVGQALRNLRASEARLAELEISQTAAREALRQAEAFYAEGLATNLERVTAQDVALQAELALATERIDLQFLRLRVLRACGTLGENLSEDAAFSAFSFNAQKREP